MTDSLKIWGTDYTGVKGFKAKDSSNNQYAYLRPQGTKSITENGNNIDVSEYAIASVNVDRTGGHVIQEGSSIVIPADEVDSGYSLEQFGEGGSNISGAIIYSSTKLRTCQFMETQITSFDGATVNAWGNASVGSERAVFRDCKNLVSVSMPLFNQTSNAATMFSGCSSLQNVYMPSLSSAVNNYFKDCTSLEKIALQKCASIGAYAFQSCTSLKYADFGVKVAINGGNAFRYCSSFDVLILRGTDALSTIQSLNNFDGTPFASDGTGGTVYIPKTFYDHLGDGTSSDYQSATNWSTLYGYGTIAWAKIEGSYYETHYADGTEIPSA